jgi:hypothetical protein
MAEGIGRRNFIKLLAGGALATWAAVRGIDVQAQSEMGRDQVLDAQIDRELDLAKQESYEVGDVFEVRDIASLADTWKKAVERSLERHEMVSVKMSAGEHLSETRIDLKIPKGAKIAWLGSGDEEGTTIKADQSLADGARRADQSSKDLHWAGSKHNLIKIVVDDGSSLVMRDLKLDGGCEEAGVGGYEAPIGPWNSIVRILGNGVGMDMYPMAYMDGLKKGLVVVDNVQTKKSISAGILVQNVRGFLGENTQAEDVDAGVVANWNDRVVLRNCQVKRGLSDGFYIDNNLSVDMYDCAASTCRQALDLQGGKSVRVFGFKAIDSAIAYRLGQSLSDQRPLDYFWLENGDSTGCALIYSIGRATGVITKAVHSEMGRWYRRFDLLFSYSGISNPSEIIGINKAKWEEEGVTRLITFDQISGEKSELAPEGYNDNLD